MIEHSPDRDSDELLFESVQQLLVAINAFAGERGTRSNGEFLVLQAKMRVVLTISIEIGEDANGIRELMQTFLRRTGWLDQDLFDLHRTVQRLLPQ